MMTNDEFEALLWSEESESLDFKREQYPFSGATDAARSKLLKDILAFANGWHLGDAYILVGVDEVKGGRCRILGVDRELDDANLQQFVNAKTQRPVSFSYSAYTYEGKTLGVIQIPSQQRPFYLVKNFGGLDKDVVYIRRGTSTDRAKPDEISAMGRAADQSALPLVTLEFGDTAERHRLGTRAVAETVRLKLKVGDAEFPRLQRPEFDLGLGTINTEYYRELFEYHSDLLFLCRLNFALVNLGSVTARDVHVEMDISDPQMELRIVEEGDAPTKPQLRYDPMSHAERAARAVHSVHETDSISAERLADRWRIDLKLDKAHPKKTEFTSSALHIGAPSSRIVPFHCRVYADNLPEPTEVELELEMNVSEAYTSLNLLVTADEYERSGP